MKKLPGPDRVSEYNELQRWLTKQRISDLSAATSAVATLQRAARDAREAAVKAASTEAAAAEAKALSAVQEVFESKLAELKLETEVVYRERLTRIARGDRQFYRDGERDLRERDKPRLAPIEKMPAAERRKRRGDGCDIVRTTTVSAQQNDYLHSVMRRLGVNMAGAVRTTIQEALDRNPLGFPAPKPAGPPPRKLPPLRAGLRWSAEGKIEPDPDHKGKQ